MVLSPRTPMHLQPGQVALGVLHQNYVRTEETRLGVRETTQLVSGEFFRMLYLKYIKRTS